MKKKVDRTLNGYYVVGFELGVTMAFAIVLLLEACVRGVFDLYPVSMVDEGLVHQVWKWLPVHVAEVLYIRDGRGYLLSNLLLYATAMMSVAFFTEIMDSAKRRTKLLQATAWCLFIVLAVAAYRYTVLANSASIAIAAPIIMEYIPMMILKKSCVRSQNEEPITVSQITMAMRVAKNEGDSGIVACAELLGVTVGDLGVCLASFVAIVALVTIGGLW